MQNAWSVVKFIVPVLLPVGAIVLAWVTGTKGATIRARLEAALGSGQLLWLAMFISSYGAYQAMAAGLFEESGIPPFVQILLILQGLILLVSTVSIDAVSQELVDNEEAMKRAYAAGHPLPTKKSAKVLYSSIVMLSVAIAMALLTEAAVA